MRKTKFLLPALVILLLVGCGKKESSKEESKDIKTGITTINTLEDIKIPVYEEDLAEETIYNPTLLSSYDDAAFSRYVSDSGTTGRATDYGFNNSDFYNTPYCYSEDTVINSEIEYTFKDKASIDYETAIMSNTGKEFEFYKKGNFLYEFTSPSTPTNDGEIKSLSQAKDIKSFAEMLDEIEFLHAKNISITSDMTKEDRNNMILIDAEIEVVEEDDSTLKGLVAGIEYDDKQYFYLYASNKEKDTSKLLEELDTNPDFDINSLLTEDNSDKKTISFDINGTAASIDAPRYFRDEEIEGNIYSKALTYVPSSQRSETAPISKYPDEEGCNEIYLTNEYYNLALTYNNFIIPEDCETEYEMYVRALGVPYGIEYDTNIMMYGSIENNEYIVEKGDITDRDGNIWKSYYIMTDYKYEENYPMIIPYYSPAVIYTRQVDNMYQIFTFSSGIPKWWDNEEFISSIDEIISSFTSHTPSTTVPSQPLSYYRTRKYDVNINGLVDKIDIEATPTDASPTDATLEIHQSGDVDEGPGHEQYLDDGKIQGTSTGDKDADEDGLSQEYIDSLPMLDDEVE